MFKKFLGFLFSLIGVFLLLKILNRKDPIDTFEPEQVERKVVNKSVNNIDAIIRKNKKKLNSRQEEILKLYKKRNVLLPSDIYAISPNLSTRTLRRDMDKLVNLNLVIQEGSTKNTRYLIKR